MLKQGEPFVGTYEDLRAFFKKQGANVRTKLPGGRFTTFDSANVAARVFGGSMRMLAYTWVDEDSIARIGADLRAAAAALA